jgi:coenzyme F420 biosynthesis associated uncharacterized protein
VTSPVSWESAQRVAGWVAAGHGTASAPPSLSDADWARLRADFDEATARAEELVVEATGLRPLEGSARALVVDRNDWVAANVASFQVLLGPLLEQLPRRSWPGPMADVGPQVAGVQLGAVLGWMATRVLGQYDLLLTERGGEGDVVRYVGPNVVALERRFGFPPRHFRLWIALHEVTHRCQFTGVPWLRPHFLSLVDQALAAARPDPRQLVAALRRAAEAARRGDNPLEEAGVLGLVAPPEQLDVLRQVQALMSLLEGHGDVTMNRAGADVVPEAAWFARVLQDRRRRANPVTRLVLQLTGLQAKLQQYEMGERFIEAVEVAGGPELVARLWEGPDLLPSLPEVRTPALWLARVQPPAATAG